MSNRRTKESPDLLSSWIHLENTCPSRSSWSTPTDVDTDLRDEESDGGIGVALHDLIDPSLPASFANHSSSSFDILSDKPYAWTGLQDLLHESHPLIWIKLDSQILLVHKFNQYLISVFHLGALSNYREVLSK